MLDGPMEYIFGNVTGAIRLEDGSVVIADEQSYNVRRYDASGRHVWTSGRNGEGPGEYGGLRLLRGCPGATITVFDWHLNRITELDQDGEVIGHAGAQRVRCQSVPGTRLHARRRFGLHAVAGFRPDGGGGRAPPLGDGAEPGAG